MDTIIETALLQAEAKRKVAFQSAGLKIKNKKIKIKITEIKRELFLGTVERASFSPTDQFRLFDSCSSLNVERKEMLYQKKKKHWKEIRTSIWFLPFLVMFLW